MVGSYDQIERDVIHLVVEKTLYGISKEICDLVGTRLKQKYGCYFDSCLDRPEYLLDVLEGIYGNAANAIIKTILDELEHLSITPKIAQFQTKLTSHAD
jgi:hypothetical protein